MSTAMKRLALAFVLGVLAAGSCRSAGARQSLGSNPAGANDADAADLRFVVELGERANDRILEDIRAFNAVAYALLGPPLGIAAFVDYHDPLNALPLMLSACAIVTGFAAVRSTEGLPTPSLSDVTLFDTFADDAQLAMRNVLTDLRRFGFVNARIRERKQRAIAWAGRFVILAIIATTAVKGVESGPTMQRTFPSDHASPPAAANVSAVKPRNTRFDVDPSERRSYAYDRSTGKPVTDEDIGAYLEMLDRPWWRFW